MVLWTIRKTSRTWAESHTHHAERKCHPSFYTPLNILTNTLPRTDNVPTSETLKTAATKGSFEPILESQG